MSSEAAEAPARPMKFPYTLSAKIAQFPLKFHVQNQWVWRYWLIGVAVSVPIFWKIHKLANSPANYKNLDAYRRREAAEHAH